MSLAGRGIVVTRPRGLAQGLARLIESASGRAILFPAIQIDELPAPAALQRLETFDLAIFISPTAVAAALRHDPQWPVRLRTAAVGAGTRRELEARGVGPVLAPGSAADSEALLALPELARMAGQRVVIFRGEGGRALLGNALRERGAVVEYAECYRRSRPPADAAALLAAWNDVHAVTVSSEEGLESLFSLLGAAGEAGLRAAPMFVGHERVAARARRLGVHEVIVAGPGDGEMLERLVAYFSR